MMTPIVFIKIKSKLDRIRWFLFNVKTKVVKCLIKNGDEILLVKLNYGPDVWKLPGGMVDRGEDPLVAVRREVKEELGIELELSGIKLLGTKAGTGQRNSSVIYYYESEFNQRHIEKNSNEIKSVRWFKVNQLPPDVSAQVETALNISTKR